MCSPPYAIRLDQRTIAGPAKRLFMSREQSLHRLFCILSREEKTVRSSMTRIVCVRRFHIIGWQRTTQ